MKKLIKSFQFALTGLGHAFNSQQNFRIEIFVAVLTVAAGIFLRISTYEWLIIITGIMVVLALELINTAFEKLCDIFSKEIDPGIKFIKDVSAAAVLTAAAGSFICGLVIFIPKAIRLF